MAAVQTIRGVVSQHHRNRFDIYRRKVRFLYLKSFPELVRGHAIVLLENMSDPDQTLFPGLKMIYVPSLAVTGFRNLEYFNILFLAQSSSLLSVSLGGINNSSDEFATSFLSVLSQRASSLQELILAGQITSHSLDLVSHFSKLNALIISGQNTTFQTSFLEQCSTLRNLTYLSMNLDASSTFSRPNPIIPHFSVPGAFPALEYVRLGGSSTELSKLLQSIAPSSLKSIMITCSPPSIHYADVFSESISLCIKECGRIAPTHRIRLQVGTGIIGRNTMTTEASLSPLKSCKALQSLEISGITLRITDDMIRDFCRDNAWQNLRTLLLPPTVSDQTPSLSSLKVLAQSCPNLHTLRISISFQNFQLVEIATLQRERLNRRVPHNLTNLSIFKVADARNGNETNTLLMAISVSLFIEYHFPNLKESKLLGNSSGDLDWWKGVEQMMGAYKMVRAETTSELQALTSV